MNDKKKILIIDDDKFLLGMYSLKFQKNNFDVRVATNGPEAIDIIKGGFNPDIMLMDVIMPIMDGFEMFAKMKEEKLASESVNIMLTNQGQPNDIDKAKKLGVHGYIVKATTIPSEVVVEVIDIYNRNKK